MTAGVMAGDSHQEFGRLVAAEIGASGNVFLLDLIRPGVFAFDRDGRLQWVTDVGAGPGELRQPMAMSLAAGGRLVIADVSNARLVSFPVGQQLLAPPDAVRLDHPGVRSLCTIEDRVYAGFLYGEMMAHELGPDGRILRSFADAPVVDTGLEGLAVPGAATLARRQVLGGRVYCDESRGYIVVTGSSHSLVRAYDTVGVLRWEVTLPDLTPVGFRMDRDGAMVAEYDHERGASFVRAMVRWDERHLLVQHEVRLRGEPPAQREFHRLDSRLLALDTGSEVKRTDGLPWIAAGRGAHFVIIENLPYPRAFLVERRRGASR